MEFERSTLIKNGYKQLSENYDRLWKEKIELEEKIQKVHEIGQILKDKGHECESLGEQLRRLVDQNSSFSGEPAGGQRLRDVSGTKSARNSGSREDTTLSAEFEVLNASQETSRCYDELVAKILAQIQEELDAKEVDLQRLQTKMRGHVNGDRRSNNVARRYGTDHVQNGQTEEINHVTAGGEDIAINPSTKIRELENIIDNMNKRIEELMFESQQMTTRITVLTKQKEELLEVNHQWDDQYRQLKADRDRLDGELRKQGQTPQPAEVQRQGQENSEASTQLVQQLTQKNEELTQALTALREERSKTDQLWVSAKKMISQEREAREAAVQMKQAAEVRCKQLEDQLQLEKQKQHSLKQEIERLARVASSENTVNGSSVGSPNVAEQIEMLKQQISVYADDFANERSDRERIQTEKEAQKERLEEFQKEITLLKEQIRIYRDDFEKERRDKERLQRQFRERGSVQVQDEPWYMVPPNDYVTMHPPQRHQQYYRYTPREFQELAFQQQQQQQLPPRRQIGGHPGGLCHGCEADGCDVIDGNAILKCPRCERVFAPNERRPFEEHIDKCTT